MPACFNKGRWPVSAAGMLLMVVLLAGLAFQASAAIESAEIRMDWGDSAAEVARWQVRDGSAPGENAWQSLLAESAADGRISRHLSLQIADSVVGPEHWQSEPQASSAGIIQRRWLSADGEWLVEQDLARAELPYRLELAIVLTRLGHDPASPGPVRLLLGPGLGEEPIEGLGIATSLYSFVEPLVRIDGSIERIRLSEPGESELLPVEADDTWAALNSRYFALLLDPTEDTGVLAYEIGLAESARPEDLPSRYLPWIGIDLAAPQLGQGESVHWQFQIFSGPKSRSALSTEHADSNYTELLFHGLWRWMRGLCFALLRVLEWLHALIPSWGLAICLLAVLVRILLYPMARWALSSQQRFSEVQREIQPAMARIKNKYKGGEQSERILRLYEKHGVSPMAGLKPLLIVLIQIPVFVALFHVLGQAFELRDASFLWIESLAEPDRLFGFGVDLPFFGAYFNLLPVLMAVTTLITIKLSPAPASSDAERRRQNIFLGLMALFFFLLFYPFPAGMVLYWTMANVLHIAQARLTRQAG